MLNTKGILNFECPTKKFLLKILCLVFCVFRVFRGLFLIWWAWLSLCLIFGGLFFLCGLCGLRGGVVLGEVNVVEEVFEFLFHVDVVDEDGVGAFEGEGGKVEYAFYAGFFEVFEHVLGAGFGKGENGYADLIFLKKFFEVFDM